MQGIGVSISCSFAKRANPSVGCSMIELCLLKVFLWYLRSYLSFRLKKGVQRASESPNIQLFKSYLCFWHAFHVLTWSYPRKITWRVLITRILDFWLRLFSYLCAYIPLTPPPEFPLLDASATFIPPLCWFRWWEWRWTCEKSTSSGCHNIHLCPNTLTAAGGHPTLVVHSRRNWHD